MSILVDPSGPDDVFRNRYAALSTLTLRRLVARHSSIGGRCDGCGFSVSELVPLCPEAAAALRELTHREGRGSSAVVWPQFSTDDLLRVAASHHPDRVGRCARCGFVFSSECDVCPTVRAVRVELEVRGVVPVRGAEPGKGLCAGKSPSWEMDGRTVVEWRRAISSCEACPLLAQCRIDAAASAERGDGPQRMIMAGNAYDSHGNIVDGARLGLYESLTTATRRREASEVAA